MRARNCSWDGQEVRCLNRMLRWVRPPFGRDGERIEFKLGPRHVEVVVANWVSRPRAGDVLLLVLAKVAWQIQ